jgi:hypothetical protein
MTVAAATHTEVAAAELASFTRQLGAMLDAGVDVLRALRIASQHSKNPHLIEAARSIARRLEDGREFHAAITPHPDIFDPFYVEMARQGETDGLLGKALLSVADYLDRVAQQQALPASGLPSSGSHFNPVVSTMAVLGVQAVGAAVIWAIATARPEVLPIIWLGPIAALWVGVCLLSGSWILMRLRQPRAAAAGESAQTPLPAKPQERKRAEADGVARVALMEQREEQEAGALQVIGAAGSRKPASNGSNGTNSKPASNGQSGQSGQNGADLTTFEPDPDPPRFEL